MIVVALRAYARTWPALLAWFLAGWTARLLLLRLAGFLADDVNSIVGLLVLCLAVLARLASYVGMFLVLRNALPHFERLDTAADRAIPGRSPGFASTWVSTLTASILPFFVIYATWGLIKEDGIAYTNQALDQSDFSKQGTALDTPFTLLTVSVVVAAFVLRQLISRLSAQLPRWTGIVAAYLEAVWVLIAVFFIRDLLAGVPDWVASRRMFAWAVDGWASLRDQIPAVDFVSNGWAWIAKQLGEVVVQPLAWVALAAIVLVGALPVLRRAQRTRTRTQLRMDAARGRASARWERLGPHTRRVLRIPVNGFLERWEPIGTALRLIWGAGPVTMGIYVIAYAALSVGTSWLTWGIYRLIGAHEGRFWAAIDTPIDLLVATIVFPLQMCLVVAAFDRALRALDETTTSSIEELEALQTES